MRIPLPERAWRRLHWLGIEPSKSETTVDGGAQGVVASGHFSGGAGGNVTVNIQGPPVEIPNPPELIRDQIQDIWKFQVRESIERKDRQELLDDRLREMLSRVESLGVQAYRAIVVSVIAFVLSVVSFGLLLFIAISLFRRFGWL